MGKPYSKDLRLRVLNALNGGMNKMTAHKTFCVSRSTIDQWIALRARTGGVEANKCFLRQRFSDSQHRRYQHRLWEMHDNTQRPHQGLQNQTPLQAFKKNYPLHAAV